LAAALADGDPVVRGAAAWALGRWRHLNDRVAEQAHAALVARMERETDADVRTEIERALA
jgi:hypothetical protein